VLCSGKVFYDLTESDDWARAKTVDVARIEMLYPFPEDEVRDLVQSLPYLQELVWLQEEPANMGAWRYAHQRLREIAGKNVTLRVVARPERASPAPGTATMYLREQRDLIEAALRS